MKAIVRDVYGTPDVLSLAELPAPTPGPGEVLLRVHGASVNPADWFLLTGVPRLVRLGTGLFRPRSRMVGRDAAGVVMAVGAGVTRLQPGDEVFGELDASYAEMVCAKEALLTPKPRGLSFEEAAALPLAGMTALQGLRDKGRVQPGHRVLVNGASGGVGTFAVQIAKAMGAEVTGVCHTESAALVRSIGADHVVDYTRDDFTAQRGHYDVILDLVGTRPLRACVAALRQSGVYVSAAGPLSALFRAALRSLVTRQVASLTASRNTSDLDALRALVDQGALRPVIDKRFTLEQAPEALWHQHRGHARGKSVIAIP